MDLTIGLAIPFLGTTLGSAMVFFMKNKLSLKVEKLLLGFASGVMIAASVWSLIIPSIDMAKEQGKIEWLPAAIGFILGILFLLLLDSLIPHLHLNDDKPEGIKAKLKKTTMMVFAVTLHNIQEGMAVGVTFAAGAMIYVVIKELIPESQTGELSKIATIGVVLFMIFDIVTDDSLTEFQMGQRTIGVAIGFILMTILAVALV